VCLACACTCLLSTFFPVLCALAHDGVGVLPKADAGKRRTRAAAFVLDNVFAAVVGVVFEYVFPYSSSTTSIELAYGAYYLYLETVRS
jgi:hypothetical protein